MPVPYLSPAKVLPGMFSIGTAPFTFTHTAFLGNNFSTGIVVKADMHTQVSMRLYLGSRGPFSLIIQEGTEVSDLGTTVQTFSRDRISDIKATTKIYDVFGVDAFGINILEAVISSGNSTTANNDLTKFILVQDTFYNISATNLSPVPEVISLTVDWVEIPT